MLAGAALLRQGGLEELARVSTSEACLFCLEAKVLDSLRCSHPACRQFSESEACMISLEANVLDSCHIASGTLPVPPPPCQSPPCQSHQGAPAPAALATATLPVASVRGAARQELEQEEVNPGPRFKTRPRKSFFLGRAPAPQVNSG